MKQIMTAIQLALVFGLLISCSSEPSKSNAVTAERCKTDTCGAEAKKCGWRDSDAKYLGCLSDCDNLAMVSASCPKQAEALYACANLGAKVDCTTGKGTGCTAEEQELLACLQGGDAGG